MTVDTIADTTDATFGEARDASWDGADESRAVATGLDLWSEPPPVIWRAALDTLEELTG